MITGILCPFPQTLRKIRIDNKYCIRLGRKFAVKDTFCLQVRNKMTNTCTTTVTIAVK